MEGGTGARRWCRSRFVRKASAFFFQRFYISLPATLDCLFFFFFYYLLFLNEQKIVKEKIYVERIGKKPLRQMLFMDVFVSGYRGVGWVN